MRVWRKIDKTLRSPGLTVALICIIGLASIIGTVPVPSHESVSGGTIIVRIIRTLGAGRLYRTWWYTWLLAFLAFLMTYCSLRRLPSVIRAFAFKPDPTTWPREDRLITHALTISKVSKDIVLGKVSRALGDTGYRAHPGSTDAENGAMLFEKGRSGILGPPLVHLGLVIAFIGGLVTHSFGTVRDITLGEGEVYQIPGTQSKIKLEKFSIVPHPGTKEPEEYVSTLMVTERDGVPSWRMLRVNQPLTVSGTTFYQMRFRPEIRHISIGVYESGSRNALGSCRLSPGEKVELPGGNLIVELGEILPDFAIDSKNNVFSQSPYFLNPAAKLSVYSSREGDKPVWTGWAFKDMLPSKTSSAGPFLFTLQRVSLKYYSGMKTVRDPGVATVYFGFALLVCGSFISCYMFRRFVSIKISADGTNGSKIRISGYSLKNQPDFAYELKGLHEHLRRAIGE